MTPDQIDILMAKLDHAEKSLDKLLEYLKPEEKQ